MPKLVYSHQYWDLMQPCDDKFATEILDFIKSDLRGCRDVAKLLAAINVLSHFALWPEPARSHSLGQLLVLLGYRYPRVQRLFLFTLLSDSMDGKVCETLKGSFVMCVVCFPVL